MSWSTRFGSNRTRRLRARLVLLALEQSKQGDTSNLDDLHGKIRKNIGTWPRRTRSWSAYLEADTWNISHGVTRATESGNKNLHQRNMRRVSMVIQDLMESLLKYKRDHRVTVLVSHTSSFSSMKLRQPSRGTKAVTFLPAQTKVAARSRNHNSRHTYRS
jgi:hypothetical protein